MERVLITGGTGFIGGQLNRLLMASGFEVTHLSRHRPQGNIKTFQWNVPEMKIDEEAVKNTHHIIHLAGANVAGSRWTSSYKKEILESRVASAQLLFQTLQNIPNEVKSFISASGVGYYGDRGDEWLNEESGSATDFLSLTCIEWESIAHQFEKLNKRVIIFRNGIVLGKDGGALPSLMKPVRLGIAPILGNGKQFFSWIHLNDLCRIYLYALSNSQINGVFNAVAPQPERFKNVMDDIAEALGKRKMNIPVPAVVLKLILGEMAQELLKSDRCTSKKIEDTGFKFDFPDLRSALIGLLK